MQMKLHIRNINKGATGPFNLPHGRANNPRLSTRHPPPCAQQGSPISSTAPSGDTPQQEKVAWDPEGIFSSASAPSGGHFARRERERGTPSASQHPAAAIPPPPGPQLHALPPSSPVNGVLASDSTLYDKESLKNNLKERYMPVDLDYPGLRVLHIDPPVFLIENFWTPEACNAMINAAENTGGMAASKIGAVNVTSAAAAASSRRTSSTLLIDAPLRKKISELDTCAADLQSAGHTLLGGDQGRPWGSPGKLPAPGQYCYEGLQATKYESGQYFMEHEDGFPTDMARDNKFQRHATLLVYLNTVENGGATSFQHLGVSVSPVQGNALLFFPAFADGSPDARTLHAADPAGDVKYVTQQWVARGFKTHTSSSTSSSSSSNSAVLNAVPRVEELLAAKKGKKKGGKKGSGATASKGFGAT